MLLDKYDALIYVIPMTYEETKAAQEQVGTVRWYIENRWGDPEQKDNAYASVTRLSNILYGVEEKPVKSAPDEDPMFSYTDLDGVVTPLAKVAIVVGHNRSAPGAWLKPPINESEFVFNNKVADALIKGDTGNITFKKFNRTPGGGYAAEIDRVYEQVNKWGPEFIVELHFNGGGGDYTCMLAAEASPMSQECAKIMSEFFATTLGIRDAGVFKSGPKDRGGRSLYAGQANTVLTEPFFGDTQHHANMVDSLRHYGIAYIYLQSITKVLQHLKNK